MRTEIKTTENYSVITIKATNKFEEELINNLKESEDEYDFTVNPIRDFAYASHRNHRLEITLTKKTK